MAKENADLEPDLKAFYSEAMSIQSTPEEKSEFFKNLASIEDRFLDINLHAEGGLKQVFSCFDKHLQKEVALAKYKNADDSREVDAFIHEAYITSCLEHPNIVPVYDVGIHDDQPFFTMKLLKGKTLKEVIDQSGAQDRDRLLEIFLRVCDAISYAHSKSILHLDLKPLNIQVDQFGDVIVYDWGIARKSDEEVTTNNRIEGSPGFMAPEQITKKFGSITVTADIYSLGVILYNIVTLQQPFSGDTESIIKSQLKGSFTYPSQIKSLAIQNGLESIIIKAMQLSPEQRYESVETFAADVRAFIGGYATNAENAGYSTLVKLLVKRNLKLFLAASIVVILIISLTAFFMKSLSEKRNEAESALLELQVSEMERAKVSKKSAGYILKFSEIAYNNRNYKKANKFLKNALALAPDNENIQNFELRVLFGEMKFAECLEKATSYNKSSEPFKSPCFKALNILKNNSFLSARQLCNLIDSAPKKSGIEWHLVHTICYTYPLQTRIEFARERIKRRSIRSFRFDLREDPDNLGLSIRGKGFSYIDCLANLPLKELDISDTGVRDLSPLKNMPLKLLNISGTVISDLRVFYTAPLEELNIRGTQIKNISSMNKTELKELTINEHCESLDFLKLCPKLKVLRYPKRKYTREYIDSLNLQAKVKDY